MPNHLKVKLNQNHDWHLQELYGKQLLVMIICDLLEKSQQKKQKDCLDLWQPIACNYQFIEIRILHFIVWLIVIFFFCKNKLIVNHC